MREPSYFFRLSAWQDRLLKLYEDNPEFIAPASRRAEVMSFVRGGLRDLSISRTTFSWGIPVPDAPGHVMYVWLDALHNYVTACGFPDEDAPRWRFWPADVHFVGKDIIRFHAVYWPAFLMSAGLPVPKRVTSNGWWLADGEKMSKSLGNVLEPRELVATFGLDQIRYFLMREKPFGADGSISHQAIINRINVELANDLGNLAQRTLSLVARNCGGVLPCRGCRVLEDAGLLTAADGLPGLVRAAIERQTFHEGPGGNLESHPFCQRLYRSPGALGTEQDRQGADGHRAARAGRHDAGGRDVAPALHATSMASMLDQLGVPVACADLRGARGTIGRRHPTAAPSGVFPRFVEPAGNGTRGRCEPRCGSKRACC